jgi:hypothetical protein
MELNKIAEGVFQLIDSATGAVLAQGTWDECFDRMAEIDQPYEQLAWGANEI